MVDCCYDAGLLNRPETLGAVPRERSMNEDRAPASTSTRVTGVPKLARAGLLERLANRARVAEIAQTRWACCCRRCPCAPDRSDTMQAPARPAPPLSASSLGQRAVPSEVLSCSDQARSGRRGGVTPLPWGPMPLPLITSIVSSGGDMPVQPLQQNAAHPTAVAQNLTFEAPF